jgi:hypothetical protein
LSLEDGGYATTEQSLAFGLAVARLFAAFLRAAVVLLTGSFLGAAFSTGETTVMCRLGCFAARSAPRAQRLVQFRLRDEASFDQHLPEAMRMSLGNAEMRRSFVWNHTPPYRLPGFRA